MKYIIDEDVCKKLHLSYPLYLTLLLLSTQTSYEANIEQLIEQNILVRQDSSYYLTDVGHELLVQALADSKEDDTDAFEQRIENLAMAMRELFPKGKKEGTTQYWRGNKREIIAKLRSFFLLVPDTYTDEQILSATKRYVEYHKNYYNMAYMRVLKYFILKNEVQHYEDKEEGHLETVSDLCSYLENEEAASVDSNWMLKIKTDNGNIN